MMLATRGDVSDIPRLHNLGYTFDLKIDGVRAVATVDDGEVELVSRSGVTITAQYPDIVEALRKMPPGHWVIDGEIAVKDERGLPSWPLTHKRNAQVRFTSGWAKKLPATFFAFDVLETSEDVRGWKFSERRHALLAAISPLNRQGEDRVAVVLNGDDGYALWEIVEKYRLEGMIAKRLDSAYRSGRSASWIKIKRTSTVTCVVGGFDPGEGGRAGTFGALHLYLLDAENHLVQVGKVGSGFSNQELREVMQALHHPPLIVEVEYLDVSPDGQLRQPVFQRMRTDVNITECTLDQLI